MTPSRARFDGRILVLPAWSMLNTDANVPHRRRILATCHLDGVDYFVCCNHKRKLFWVHAVGKGFAGDFSRASNAVATRDGAKANAWVESVNSKQVRIE